MKTYILKKRQFFLILLQVMAVICHFIGPRALAATAIIPKAQIKTLMTKKPAHQPSSASLPTKKFSKPKGPRWQPRVHCAKLLEAPKLNSPEEAQLAKEQALAFAEMPPTAPLEPLLPEEALEEVFKSLSEANRLRQKYESAYERQEEDRLLFLEKAKEYNSKLKNYLERQGILTVESELAPEIQDEIKLSWPTLVISPEGDSRLGRFANGLKKRYQTELIIDLLWLERNGQARAAFLQNSNKLLISTDAIRNERATITEMHEVIHVRFKAQREERETEMGNVPLQMFFVSSEPIKSEKHVHYYEYEMAFEELWTYSYEVSASAAQIDDPADLAIETDLPKIIRSLKGLAETAERAIERAKEANLQNQVGIEDINKVPHTLFKVTDEFIFAVSLPADTKENAIDYAISEMNRAQRLSRFIQDYWLQSEEMSPADLLKKSLEYKTELMDFIKELNSGRSTAEATFDIIA